MMKKINIIPIVFIIIFVFSSCGCDKPKQQIVVQTSASTSHFETTTQTTTKIKKKKYVKSINSNKFHYKDCFWAKRILDENKVYSKNRKQLIKFGYTPCEECRP